MLDYPEDRLALADHDGSVHVRDVVLPPSDLWSPEFKRFYAGMDISSLDKLAARVPARTATKAEWDEFDSWLDDHYNAEPLARALEQYPVDVVDTKIAGVRVGIITPKEGIAPENEGRILINLHGGGFVYNRGLSDGQLESVPVASIGRIRVVTLDYRQAPFHSYPAASEDVEAVYLALLKQYRPETIGIYGCSAGGVLTAQAVARFQSRALPRPGAVGIFSMAPPPPFPCVAPWERGWGESGLWFSGSPKNEPSEDDKKLWNTVQWYMEGASLDDTNAYPGSSDAVLAKFPPTLFLSGTRDFAVSTVIAANARFLKLGVDSSLYIMEGATHAAHVVAVGAPEAHDAHAHTARWFHQHLAG